MIVAEDLTRIYTRKTRKHLFSKAVVSNFTAVDHLSLEVKAGERVAFIGPNGAGENNHLADADGPFVSYVGPGDGEWAYSLGGSQDIGPVDWACVRAKVPAVGGFAGVGLFPVYAGDLWH
jgi:ABC-type hemin transport system ATPase subunit